MTASEYALTKGASLVASFKNARYEVLLLRKNNGSMSVVTRSPTKTDYIRNFDSITAAYANFSSYVQEAGEQI